MVKTEPLIKVVDLRVWFPFREGKWRRHLRHLHAVDDVSFSIDRGETVGLVGESGCGKTTTGRALLRLERATAGTVEFDGTDVFGISEQEMRRLRARMQIIFQDPYASLDPRMSIGASVAEGLVAQGVRDRKELDRSVARTLSMVGLRSDMSDRKPHELSGGQRQRVVIARALVCEPDFIVCDEAVSALDVSVRAQILNLLQDLQEQLSLTYLFIAHDLATVQHVSDRVAVMYLGKIVELADANDLYEHPRHPYTRALLAAIPDPDPRSPSTHASLEGEVPSPVDLPTGCRFRTRCPLAIERCAHDEPELLTVGSRHQVACHVTGATTDSA
jgi:oligopeptide transport system ATP-binding protein